ncbi:coiled-coil domain-containing protein 50-like isoform X2 [Silurus meridionalis]|nr:coiled-coil domain-containing protein 50-like isoform X2 [Silurus meridionalis]
MTCSVFPSLWLVCREKQDCKYAREIQEELRRCDEEARRREEEDEEMAKQLQDEEELKIRQERAESGHHEDGGVSPLSHVYTLSCSRFQTTDTDMDFRTVQVAQDEELARFMQRQEKKGNRWSRDLLALERSHDPSGTGGKKNWTQRSPGGNRKAGSRAAHRLVNSSFKYPEKMFYWVAMKERIMCAGICLAPRTPHSIFYDYLPEPSVAPPSRRHADKPGRHKAKEKRESCKQQ